MLFLGRYEYTMDDRGRVPVPARFRDAFAGGIILAPAPPRCLRVYTAEAYERTAALILSQGSHTAGGQELRRAFFGRSYEGELDKAARLLVPAPLRQKLELNGVVTMLGCGEYVELWSSGSCDAGLAAAVASYSDHLAALDPVASEAASNRLAATLRRDAGKVKVDDE